MYRLARSSVSLVRGAAAATNSLNATRPMVALLSSSTSNSSGNKSGSGARKWLFGAAAAGGVAATTSTVVYAEGKKSNESLSYNDGVLVYTYEQDGVEYAVEYTKDGASEPAPRGSRAAEEVVVPAKAPESPEEALDMVKDINARVQAVEKNLGVPAVGRKEDAASSFPYFTAENKSLVKKHLTLEMWAQLKDRVTPNGFTLNRAIQSTCDNQDSGVGLYAGDEDAYTIFAPLFDAVIDDYHGGYKPTDTHVSDMDGSKLHGNPDPEGKYVISTRIRVGRNIRGLGLPPGATRSQRRESERVITTGLNKLASDLSGKYYPLGSMSEAERKQLVEDHFLFKKGDRFLESAGANRDWPESRGIFHNNEKTFLVWVNEEDCMRIISMQKGGDVKQVFNRLARGIAGVEDQVKAAGYEFAHNDHLGYIHSCPTNCGTGMRASVHVKLPHTSTHPDFKKWCAKLRLQPRGIHGEHSETTGGVYDISNKERLGKSEIQLVQTMIDGVTKLIQIEKALEKGQAPPSV